VVRDSRNFFWELGFDLYEPDQLNFSHLSEKNEIQQADNLNFRFCLLELAAGVIKK
jgi:hypothetical protein